MAWPCPLPRPEPNPDRKACLKTLRKWAWSAAVPNPVSGVGAWEDEFPTPLAGLSREDSDALDHVVVPLPGGPANVDSRTTQRRFVHRSLREHLVAQTRRPEDVRRRRCQGTAATPVV